MGGYNSPAGRKLRFGRPNNLYSVSMSGLNPVAPQNSSALKINGLSFVLISGNGANVRLKLLGPSGTL